MHNYTVIQIDHPSKKNKVECQKISISKKSIEGVLELLKRESERKFPYFPKLRAAWYYLIYHLPMPIQYLDDSFILRARPNSPTEIFSHRDEINYNKSCPERCMPGRFNMKGEAVFYGAIPLSSQQNNGALTTILESYKNLISDENDEMSQYLTIGRWMIRKKIPLIVMTFFEEAFIKCDSVKSINPIYIEFLSKMYSDEDTGKLKIFHQFISEAAGKKTDSENHYLLTTSFFHAVRHFNGDDIGLLYSSSSTENSGLNVVLPPAMIDDDYLDLDLVTMYKCQRWADDRTQFSLFPCANKAAVDAKGFFKLVKYW